MEINPFRRKLLCSLFLALKKSIYKGGISSYKGRRVKVGLSYGHFVFYLKFAKRPFYSFLDP